MELILMDQSAADYSVGSISRPAKPHMADLLKTTVLCLLYVLPAVFMMACDDHSDCGSNDNCNTQSGSIQWFIKPNLASISGHTGVTLVPGAKGAYQQSTEYTCGPSAILTVLLYYNVAGYTATAASELKIAQEAGCGMGTGPDRPGTSPDKMVHWLETHDLNVRVTYENKGDGSQLDSLFANLRKGIPTIVEWTDLMGHWIVAIGYDDRGDTDPWNDVLIFADPYDHYDGCQDGLIVFSAQRFYWLWWDQFNFDTPVWRTMITVTPK
jgi:predicted double-glycine peptidase